MDTVRISKPLLYGGIAVFVIILVIVVWCMLRKKKDGFVTPNNPPLPPSNQPTVIPAQQNHQQGNGKAQITAFVTKTCPHCVKLEPIWKEFQSKMQGSGIDVTTVRCDAEGKEMCSKMSLPGVPTIMMKKPSGEVVTYSGPRTLEGLMNFVKTDK